MYHFVIRRIIHRAFRDLSAGDYEAPLKRFFPDVTLCLPGDHALGGELHGISAAREWFRRVFRLFPDLQYEVLAGSVSGMPWNTVVTTRLRLRATLPGGRAYANEGMQFLRLRWGRAVEDRLYEDTQRLVETLAYLARQGVDEARAAPLGHPSPTTALPPPTAGRAEHEAVTA